jgi:hypothetical protein
MAAYLDRPPVTGYAMAQSSHYYGRDRSYTMDSGISNNTSGLEDQMGHLNITTNYGSHRGGNTTTGATGNSSTRQQRKPGNRPFIRVMQTNGAQSTACATNARTFLRLDEYVAADTIKC